MHIAKSFSGAVNVVTHTAPHHADEVFATAMLDSIFNIVLYRTRDRDIIDSVNGIVYDVGGEYDAKKLRFDHHQREFEECRSDGTPYSSAGLIWRHYGRDVIIALACDILSEEIVDEIFNYVDNNLIKGIDAVDSGMVAINENGMSVSSVISAFNPTWEESDVDPDEQFAEAVKVARKILEREVKIAKSIVLGRKYVNEQIE